MRFNFKTSFYRCFKKLSPFKQKLVLEAIDKLKVFYETRQLSLGLGLKNLRGNYWEIRLSLKDRVLFYLSEGNISFILVGNHDEIRRYLKSL